MKTLATILLLIVLTSPASARWALFDNKASADAFGADVQVACDAAHKPNQPVIKIIPVYIQWSGKWAVNLPVELEGIGEASWAGDQAGPIPTGAYGVIVDNVDPPREENEIP